MIKNPVLFSLEKDFQETPTSNLKGLNVLCYSIWLGKCSKRQQKPCLSSLGCPIKQQASYHWDRMTTTAGDKPMPLCPAARQDSPTTPTTSTQKHMHKGTDCTYKNKHLHTEKYDCYFKVLECWVRSHRHEHRK
ncbi:hypothetical protein FQA47_025170 [Oryzias melastigma]|uniref:Uncharacterized protein n=1 Tax=Oryzias melastigma TaxID=30732 RepID=A0A834CR94_ORYME|nr:hypothetical protein FQA47_025170 [Oryzias melastigma]